MSGSTNAHLFDSQGRRITYLRLSVTDRCQFRCVYCLPPEGIASLPKSDYLTPEQMERLVRALAEMGVWRLRLTGGEPLLRRDIVSLVARFSSIPRIRDLALTTNGERLPELAADLKAAGLMRVNVSLDSLDPARFRELTLSGSFERVREGIFRALEAGLKVKVNVVAMRGISEAEIDDFVELAYAHPLEVRFIEFMPLCGGGWSREASLPIAGLRSRAAERRRLIRIPRNGEVAESYALAGGKGRVGFIASMTEPFCSTCSRIRVGATGKVRLCLFSKLEYDLKPALAAGADTAELQREIRRAVSRKPASHPWAAVSKKHPRPEESGLIRSVGG
ncbi:MAG TPA: GTP 3',8-cyclase MoaA [bacterium]|nr:GTP 3',8-cyclase MoaA [bacterium]